MKFLSQYQNHRLVIEPTQQLLQNGVTYVQPGKVIEFENFQYETTDKKEISFLKKHRLFGSVIFLDNQEEDQEEEKK